MPGAADEKLLKDAATLELEGGRSEDKIHVKVRVTNAKAGHHIPTDHPARNILLVISALDANGHELEHVGNQVIPEWGGKGNSPTDYAGRPGKGYAKILEEKWTEISPTVAYWNPTILRKDTRIPALATDTTDYEFAAPKNGGPVVVKAKLIFRRAFKLLAEMKRWDISDVLMNAATLVIAPDPNQQ
jgi:hypothetical protein